MSNSPEKIRIDSLLHEKGLAKSRSSAQSLIERGFVLADGKKIEKVSQLVSPVANITITEDLPFVGRGGEKLAQALDIFKIDVVNKKALDIGSSTGGFTDCLLQRGASHVTAIDVGTDQFDKDLRNDPRITLLEQTDFRDYGKKYLASADELFDIIVIDVSFISLTEILPVARALLRPDGIIVALIKPQFEVGKDELSRGGIVRDAKLHEKVLEKVQLFSLQNDLEIKAIIDSPILGGDGNKEFLAKIEHKTLPGIHTIWKPVGASSNQYLNILRRTINKKKIGHAGTLDPLAEGILIIGIDRTGTRLMDSFMKQEKEYVASIELGATSETDDGEGPITKKDPHSYRIPNEEAIKKALSDFIGTIDQIPPKYSALKIGGKPAYERIRKGEKFELSSRKVEIRSIDIINYKFPHLEVKVTCGSGTYIRTLAKDLGEKLQTGAYLTGLIRTRIGTMNKYTCRDFSSEKN